MPARPLYQNQTPNQRNSTPQKSKLEVQFEDFIPVTTIRVMKTFYKKSGCLSNTKTGQKQKIKNQ